MHIYKIPVVSQSSAEGHGVPQPGRKTASLLIVFATSVSESPLSIFPFRRLNEAKLHVFVVPMAAKWGSWDDSLVFLKRTLGPSAVLAPFFAWWWLCLRLYMCDSHFCMPFVSGLQYLGTGCWKQGIFSLSEASLPITGHSCLPGMSAFLLLFLAFSWEREGSWSGLRWAAAGSWPLPPLHGLRAGWLACYFTEFPNILAGNIFSADQKLTRQGYDLPKST